MKKRVLYFDFLNITAALGVIFLHCNGIAHNYSDTLAWYQALLVEVVFYWPVPIFFMLSGATLMGYRERYSTSEFFKKRFLRTVIPFILWTLISAAYKDINPFETGFKDFLNRCIGTSIENVYWFFIPLFAIYLSMPVISLLKEQRKILWYMVGGVFLLSSFLPLVCGYFGIGWNYSLSMLTAGGNLIFVILGYLLSTQEIKKKYRLIIYALGILSAAFRYFMTVYLSVQDGKINKFFFGYTQFHSVFLAAAVLCFLNIQILLKNLGNIKRLLTP